MNSNLGVLRYGGNQWELIYRDAGQIRMDRVPEVSPEDLIAVIGRLLSDRKKMEILITIPTSWCLVAITQSSLDSESLPRNGAPWPVALFPIDTRFLYCASTRIKHGFLVVGTDRGQLDALVAAVGSYSRIRGIIPEPIFLGQLLSPGDGVTVITDTEWADILWFRDGRIEQWRTCACEETVIRREITSILNREPHQNELTTVEVPHNEELANRVLDALDPAITYEKEFWLELHHPAISRRASNIERAARRIAWASAASFLIAAVGFQIAAYRADQERSRLAAHITEQYHQMFQGRDLPPDIQLALASEHRRLERLALGEQDERGQISPNAQFAACLRSIPRDARVRLNEMRFGNVAFLLDGETRTIGDVERIASSLKTSGLLNPDPPRTEQRGASAEAGSINFLVTGKSGGLP